MERDAAETTGAGEEPNPADEGEATKPPETILRQELAVGADQLARPTRGLALAALSAGLDIGFGPLLVVTVIALSAGDSLAVRLGTAFAYSIGFLVVILGRSELFTEHTTLAVLPLLSGEVSVGAVGRLWGIVYAGNIVGVVLFSLLAAPLGIGLGLFESDHAAEMAHHLLDFGAPVMVGSGIVAGWMMGLVSWLVTAARDTMSQVVLIVLLTGSIAFLGLHHSIAGSAEVLIGVFAADIGISEWFRFLLWATLGNAIGGVFLVAALKYGHTTQIGRTRAGTN